MESKSIFASAIIFALFILVIDIVFVVLDLISTSFAGTIAILITIIIIVLGVLAYLTNNKGIINT